MKKLLFALFGLLLIGSSLIPVTTSASPASQTNYSIGPTPTPMRGIQRHG